MENKHEIKINSDYVHIGVIGIPNSGKSSLVNALREDRVSIISKNETKPIINTIIEADEDVLNPEEVYKKIKECDEDTKETITSITSNTYRLPVSEFGKMIPKKRIYLYDTCGKGGKYDSVITPYIKEYLQKFAVIFLTLDCLEKIDSGPQHDLIELVLEEVKRTNNLTRVIVVLNKVDLYNEDDMRMTKQELIEKINAKFEHVDHYKLVSMNTKLAFAYRYIMKHKNMNIDRVYINLVALAELSTGWVDIPETKLVDSIVNSINSRTGKSHPGVISGFNDLMEAYKELVVEYAGDIYKKRFEYELKNMKLNPTTNFEDILKHYEQIIDPDHSKPIHSQYLFDVIESNLKVMSTIISDIHQFNLLITRYNKVMKMFLDEEKLSKLLKEYYAELLETLSDKKCNFLKEWMSVVNGCIHYISETSIVQLLVTFFLQSFDRNMLIRSGFTNINEYAHTVESIVKQFKTVDCKSLIWSFIVYTFVAYASNPKQFEDNLYEDGTEMTGPMNLVLVHTLIDKIDDAKNKHVAIYNLKYLYNMNLDPKEYMQVTEKVMDSENNIIGTLMPSLTFFVDYLNDDIELDPVTDTPGQE